MTKALRLAVRKRHFLNRRAVPIGLFKNGLRLPEWSREVVRSEGNRWLIPNGNGNSAQLDVALIERLRDAGGVQANGRGTQDRPVRAASFLESVGAAPPHPNGDGVAPHLNVADAPTSSIAVQALPHPLVEPDEARERQEAVIDIARAGFIAAVLVLLVVIAHGSQIRALVIGSVSCLLFILLRRASQNLLPVVLRRATRSVALPALAFSTILLFALRVSGLEVEPWTVVAIGGAAFVLFAFQDEEPRRQRVLLVGQGSGSAELLDELARSPKLFEVVAAVGEPQILDEHAAGSRYESIAELGVALERHGADFVVVNVRSGRQEVFEALLDVVDSGFRVVDLPEFYEHAFGRVPIAHLNSAWFMSLLRVYQRSYTADAKRLFDLVVAALAIVIVLPFLPLIALLVGRPIFYRQIRVGQWGKTFKMYKIRTMQPEAEEQGNPIFAAVDDPRVTKVGRLLRKARIDELPQLWNVLVGDMSVVGPRPERPEFDSSLAQDIPGWTRRNLVKPGITGWAQINAGYADDTASTLEKLSYDLWYLRHSSILVDLLICFRTLPRLVVGFGAR